MNDNIPDRTSHVMSWMLYFLAGGVTGAGVALLLAPQSGRATREMMRRKLDDTAGSARGLRDHLIHRGQEIRDEVTHRVNGAVSALSGNGEAQLPG